MKDIFEKMEKFFARDPVCGNVSGDSLAQLALLRKGALLFFAYYLLLGVLVGITNGFSYSAVALIAAGIMLCVDIFSFYSGALYVTMSGAAFIVMLSIALEYQLGTNVGIELVLFSVIPLIFSSIRLGTFTKVMIGAGVTVLHLTIITLCKLGFLANTNAISGGFLITGMSQIVFVMMIMLVSYYFCKQYTQAEHQVYIVNRQLKKMASMDPLTGLMNRRGMSDVLEDMEEAYKNGTHGLSIAIGDIDFFKKVNDTYGHDCGDYVLKTVSAYFAKFMEDKGEICRWGGEEFLFAFNNKNADDVFVMLNDMRHTIKHMQFEFNGIEFKVTMTFGLEEYTPYAQLETTIKKADEKLYLGKESGRDKVVY